MRSIVSLVDTDPFQFSCKSSQHTIIGNFFQLACKGVKYDSPQRKKPWLVPQWVPYNVCSTAIIFPPPCMWNHLQNQRTILFISKTMLSVITDIHMYVMCAYMSIYFKRVILGWFCLCCEEFLRWFLKLSWNLILHKATKNIKCFFRF